MFPLKLLRRGSEGSANNKIRCNQKDVSSYLQGLEQLPLFYIYCTGSFGPHFHLKGHLVLFLEWFGQLVDMYKNTLLCLQVIDEAKAFFLIKEGHHPRSYRISLRPFRLFGHTNLHVFLPEGFLFAGIWRCRRNVSILVQVSHHFVQGFSFLRICLTFLHFFPLILLLL